MISKFINTIVIQDYVKHVSKPFVFKKPIPSAQATKNIVKGYIQQPNEYVNENPWHFVFHYPLKHVFSYELLFNFRIKFISRYTALRYGKTIRNSRRWMVGG